uniref:Signal recognition particle 19 kDa protein n=1 Tax=Esox lucius TaxID=8010 RepID=A0A6Q2ZDC4_ESOLU
MSTATNAASHVNCLLINSGKEFLQCQCSCQAVENPTCAEIRDVLTAAGMNVYVENKMYPREWNRDVQFRGRVRVQLKQDDGTLYNDKFPSRKDVMFYVAETIPKLKSRTQKGGGGDTSSQQGEGGKKGKKKKK